MNRIRVLVVDESRDFREGLLAWFKDDPLIEIVGAVRTGQEAFAGIEGLRPDLVLLDVRLQPTGGFDAARRIRALHPALVVVLTSFLSSEAARQAAASAGAERFLAKSEVVEGLTALAREILGRRRTDES